MPPGHVRGRAAKVHKLQRVAHLGAQRAHCRVCNAQAELAVLIVAFASCAHVSRTVWKTAAAHPQHLTLPFVINAQQCAKPQVTSVAFWFVPDVKLTKGRLSPTSGA